MGVRVDEADDARIVLRAPLEANANFKGSAFGGSLFSLGALAGWAWLTRHLALERLEADAVIQSSTIRYLEPVHGEFRAVLAAPAPAAVGAFRRMMARSGRGRIALSVDVFDGTTLASRFEGRYAAALRAAEPRGAAGVGPGAGLG
jgi:thioesterase domain-containing protein